MDTKMLNAKKARENLLRKNVTVRLPERVFKALKERAVKKGVNFQTLLSSILDHSVYSD